ALAFSPDGTILASSGEGESKTTGRGRSVETGAVVWEVRTGKKIRELDAGGRSLAFSPDGKHLLIADSLDLRWNTKTWEEEPLPGRQALANGNLGGSISSVALSPDGRSLGVACFGRTVHVLNFKSQQAQKLAAELPNCPFVIFSSDSKHLLTAGGDYFRVWDL